MSDKPPSPVPELLAAYADGELEPAECARVAAWLAEHPEALETIEDQRRLTRLFQEDAPAEPSEARWATVLHHMEARLADRKRVVLPLNGVERLAPVPLPAPPRRRRHALAIGGTALAAVAAAVFLAILLRPGTPSPFPSPRPGPAPEDEVFPVVSARDVLITSMDDDDADLLVIGEAPLPGPIVLATPDDVKIEKIEQDTDGMLPKQLNSWPNMPMIIAPLQPEPEEEK